PNIVQIYEIDTRDGHPFFSLEYVEGGSLQEKLEGAPLPPREAAGLLEVLARAMDYAHQHGIVHRDLKPANVLLQPAPAGSPDGVPLGGDRPDAAKRWLPKITDFGLAKRLQDDVSQTKTDAILGTPTYMAPEQA